MRRAKPATRRASVARAGAPLDAAASAAIEAWASTKVLDHAQLAFCRQAVGGISPPSAHAARVYLTALASLVAWCVAEHVPVDAAHVFSPATYERWFSSLTGFSESSRSSYRGRIRALAYVHAPHLQPPSPAIAKKSASTKPPYAEGEIARWLACARAQPTAHGRARLTALICLGAGAGCSATDLRFCTKDHLFRHVSGALVVRVEGPRARLVPVLPPYAALLEEAAAGMEAGRPLIGGIDPDRANLTTNTLARIKGGRDLPALEMGRLRATWWKEVLGSIGYGAVMAAAGMRLAAPAEILAHLPTPSLDDVVRACGGAP